MKIIELFLFCILISLVNEGKGQCEIFSDAELVIKQLNYKGDLSKSLDRNVKRLVKNDMSGYFMIFDFTDISSNIDSILICDKAKEGNSFTWVNLKQSSGIHFQSLTLVEILNQPFLVVYLGCARLEVPIFSGKDYYKFEKIEKHTNVISQEFEYQVTLNWITIK